MCDDGIHSRPRPHHVLHHIPHTRLSTPAALPSSREVSPVFPFPTPPPKHHHDGRCPCGRGLVCVDNVTAAILVTMASAGWVLPMPLAWLLLAAVAVVPVPARAIDDVCRVRPSRASHPLHHSLTACTFDLPWCPPARLVCPGPPDAISESHGQYMHRPPFSSFHPWPFARDGIYRLPRSQTLRLVDVSAVWPMPMPSTDPGRPTRWLRITGRHRM